MAIKLLNIISNIMLIGVTMYDLLFIMPPKLPYAFVVVIITLTHGIFGLVNATLLNPEEYAHSDMVTGAVVESIMLPMTIIEMSINDAVTNNIWLHLATFLPMVLDLLELLTLPCYSASLNRRPNHFSLWSNIAIVLYLAVSHKQVLYTALALAELVAYYGGLYLDRNNTFLGPNLRLLSKSGMMALLKYLLINMAIGKTRESTNLSDFFN